MSTGNVIGISASCKSVAARAIVCVAALAFLGGCSGIGKALGFSKRPPDEFEVLAKAPLVVPPDYNLRPPAEEEQGLRERNPRQMAFSALFPPKPKTAMPAVPADSVGVAPIAPDDEPADVNASPDQGN